MQFRETRVPARIRVSVFDDSMRKPRILDPPVTRASSQYGNSSGMFDYRRAHKGASIDRAFPALDCLRKGRNAGDRARTRNASFPTAIKHTELSEYFYTLPAGNSDSH